MLDVDGVGFEEFELDASDAGGGFFIFHFSVEFRLLLRDRKWFNPTRGTTARR